MYRHTQPGFVTGIALAAGAAVCALVMIVSGAWFLLALLLLLGIAGVLFSALTTSVHDGMLECAFGPGLIRKRIALEEIEDVSVVRTPWYFGWGIRLIPGGWMWNVSGTRGVELRLRDGRRFRVGSDEPERLAAAIRAGRTGA